MSKPAPLELLDAATVARLLRPGEAVEALEAALRGGLDPATATPRSSLPTPAGELLLMPAQAGEAAGVKVVGVAPGNGRLGLPRIQGLYLLFDAATLTPRAVLDGAALTTLRTPAVSVAAVLPVLADRPLRVAVLGRGPQAGGHVATLAAVRPLAAVAHLVRTPSGPDQRELGSAAADEALRTADVVVCATSAREPLFDSTLLRDDVVVIAVGSHEPDARELDAALLGRATVVVEDVGTALREAGDVVLAVAEGALDPADLVPMREVVTGTMLPAAGRPLVVKTVGMAWQDLVVAEAVLDRS
jgi:ornithine cyclodeaminase